MREGDASGDDGTKGGGVVGDPESSRKCAGH